ncbi:MAG TPA: RsmB/NOP family class I SAM-dependent RNA methyltransferase [Candidatus Acetothermia bacterium]|nr:RsmB/NOP family class I SAM-dependent RNA methyltransferase [Candidatus Acetothermia bacterium]
MSKRSGLERYREIITDWDEFIAACVRPLPLTIRVNTLQASPDEVHSRLMSKGFSLTPISWADNLFHADTASVSKTIEHWLGLFYIQEAVQTLPVRALDPQPGETILDMAAAPGGKCTHIASMMENRGPLVANEPVGKRQPSLMANINRLGVLNATVTAYRGESFPMHARFDRILLDAPCSAEGTLRKESSLRDGATGSAIARLSRLQRRLILRAYDLLKPEGTLVYSTCTFAPEENEGTVSYLLSERDALLEQVKLPLTAAAGITTWNGEEYAPEISRCVRIYPHHVDSGGGFIARLRKPAR